MRSGLRSPCAAPVRLSTSSSIRRCAAKPTISRSKSASELFSSSVRRLIISSVIVGSLVRVEVQRPNPYRRSAMTTAVDKWPAAARLVAVAAAVHLPTAPTPPQGARPSEFENHNWNLSLCNRCHYLGSAPRRVSYRYRTSGSHISWSHNRWGINGEWNTRDFAAHSPHSSFLFRQETVSGAILF